MTKVKAAFYRVGNSDIATDAFLRGVGLEPITLLPVTTTTITKGVFYAPEFACFPFKVSVGMLKQALENGAKLFIMLGGNAQFTCQLEDFAQAQEYIMKKTGHEFEIIRFDSAKPNRIVAKFKKYNPKLTLRQAASALLLGRQKLLILDRLEEQYREIYLAVNKRRAETFKHRWEKKIDEKDSITGIYLLNGFMKKEFEELPKANMQNVLKIAVIGDVYCLNEKAINNNIYERLLDMGVYVDQSLKFSHMMGGAIGGAMIKSPREMLLENESKKYLKHNVAGFAEHTVKDAIRYAEEGYDGLIHIYPFTCMPEITVRNILPKLGEDYHIPILYLPIDEQTGDAGFTIRIEAFVDLIKIRKGKQEGKT
ncbi:MAG: hypothetical protein WC916_07430 [Candidatus Woesearchaeota archaeon]